VATASERGKRGSSIVESPTVATSGVERGASGRRTKIFVSHSHEYEDLARDFKRSIHSIACCASMVVSIYQANPGGTKWREWVRSELRDTDIFVLLYPHAGMQFKWCSYELGAFLGGADRPYVCIRNTNIKTPLDITDEFQDCLANTKGIGQFLKSLFVDGAYTDGIPICPHAGIQGSDAWTRLQAAAVDLAGSFERARTRRDYYTQRICIEPDGKHDNAFDLATDLDEAIITGEEWALRLLALQPNVKWPVLKRELERRRPPPQWPIELVSAFQKIKSGPIPPPFTPFRAGDKVYLPVITRAESIDERLRRVYLIFVEADPSQMRSFFDIWVAPPGAAGSWTTLIRALLMVLHTRWLHVVPMLNAVRMLEEEDEDRARTLLAEIRETMAAFERDWIERDVNLLEAYSDIVDENLDREGRDLESEYRRICQEMRALAAPLARSLPAVVERWITHNTRYARFNAQLVKIKAQNLTRRPRPVDDAQA
jgi:hypothetical protein